MSNPQLSVTTNKTEYNPGEAITGSWMSTDADNATLTVRAVGVDSTGNEVTVDTTITRVDPFDMQRVHIVETGQDMILDEVNRTFTGTVPTA